MILVGLCRLGGDAELRYTPDGTPVANFSVAYNYGRKGSDNKKPTQWVEASLWNDRAVSLTPFLKKGVGLDLVLEDVHIETFDRRDGGGQGTKLVGLVVLLEFASKGEHAGDSKPPAAEKPASKPATPPAGGGNFNDFDDDQPF